MNKKILCETKNGRTIANRGYDYDGKRVNKKMRRRNDKLAAREV